VRSKESVKTEKRKLAEIGEGETGRGQDLHWCTQKKKKRRKGESMPNGDASRGSYGMVKETLLRTPERSHRALKKEK